jgi:hypothetical protein
MKSKEKKPGHFEIEAWGMLLFFAILIAGFFAIAKFLPYYSKYKAEKQRIQQQTTQQQTAGQPDRAK